MSSERTWAIVVVEAVVVGVGLAALSALLFVPLYHYHKMDIHVVTIRKMHTGWTAYSAALLFLFFVGAVFHLLFEALDWNRRYCASAFP